MKTGSMRRQRPAGSKKIPIRIVKQDGSETVEMITVMDNGTRNSLCLDCKKDPDSLQEEYLVHDEVWLAAVPSGAGRLCIGCLEKRLKRKLRRNDFKPLSLDAFEHGMAASKRLKNRIARKRASGPKGTGFRGAR